MVLVDNATTKIVEMLTCTSTSGLGAPFAYNNIPKINGCLYPCTPSTTL